MVSGTLGCGSMSFLLVFLGVTGFVASLLAVVLAAIDARVAMKTAVGTVFLGALTMLLASASERSLRERVDQAVALAGEDARKAERLRVDGYNDASACRKLGLRGAAMPLTAGAVAVALTFVRTRRRARAQ
jgi:hypothetical protein